MSLPSRREFLSSTMAAGMGAALVSGAASSAQAQPVEHSAGLLAPGQVILFQGDSITDAGRSREHADEANKHAGMGNGYAWMAASELLVGQPALDLKIYNRGISGNKVFQLADRWDKDCLSLKPDILSILIGVNDIWHHLNGQYDGTVETYEQDFRALLKRTRDALPEVKLVICEPFVLRCGAVNDKWFPQFDEFRAAAKKLSEEFQTVFVPYQEMFDRAIEYAEPDHWAGDGVHPSPFGAALMAHAWLMAVSHGG